MSLSTAQSEIYKNSPLIEAVYEIRYSPLLAIESDRDKFYNKIKDVFPNVTIPKSNLEPYIFEKQDRSWLILLSPVFIAISCKKYEGFQVYKKECLKLLLVFSELFKVEKMTRSGLRYVNIIPFTRESGIIPLKSFLNIGINLPKAIPSIFKAASLIFVSQLEKGSITTRVEPAMSPDQSQEALILDFDYAKEADLNYKNLDEYLEESHTHTKALFEGLVTENYRKIMRGEVVT
jgi:uncharacterized protein (TIGR04255 family)